jgi:preprotein translocase subunit YajC
VSLLLVYVVIIGGVMIFMMNRSKKKQSAQQSLTQNALVVGAEVRTIGGLIGEVVEVTDAHVIIETTPDVRLKFIKSAIAGVVAPSELEEIEESDSADADVEDDAEPTDVASSTPVAEPAGDTGLNGTDLGSAVEERTEISTKS